MRAPRGVVNPVGANPIYAKVSHSIEQNSALREATNLVKPEGRMNQAVMKVNELNPVIINVTGVDVFHISGRRKHNTRYWRECGEPVGVLDNGMIQDGMTMNVGDPLNSFNKKSERYLETSQKWQECREGLVGVGLRGSTLSTGKPCTWGSAQQRRNRFSASLTGTRRPG